MMDIVGIDVIGTVGMIIIVTHITIDRQALVGVKSQTLADYVGMESSDRNLVGFHQGRLPCFLIGLLFVGTQLITVQLLPPITGVTAYLTFLNVQIGLFIQSTFL